MYILLAIYRLLDVAITVYGKDKSWVQGMITEHLYGIRRKRNARAARS